MKENSIKKEQSSIEEDIILLKDFTEEIGRAHV